MLENGIYILWQTSSSPDKNPGERSRAHGPSCKVRNVNYSAVMLGKLLSHGHNLGKTPWKRTSRLCYITNCKAPNP